MTRESPFSPAKDDAMTGAPMTMLPFSSVEMKGFPGPVNTRSVGGKTLGGGLMSPVGRKSVKLILPNGSDRFGSSSARYSTAAVAGGSLEAR